MKKIIYSLLVIVLFLNISNICYADYGIPIMNPYEAKIINQGGAVINSYTSTNNTVIPYGTTVEVEYEFNNKAFVRYNNNPGEINLEDIAPVTEVFENKEPKTEEKDMYVYRKEAYLYNGPSIKYSKVDGGYELPVGTIVHIKSCSDAWGYVEYEGKSGWVYIYTSDAVSPYNMVCSLTEIQKEEFAYYYTQKEIVLNSSVGAEDIVGTIPAGEHIKSYFYSYYPDPHGKTIYIEHNGVKGWYTIDLREVFQDYSSITDYTAIAINNVELYSDISYDENEFKFSNQVGTIPQRKEVKVIYETLDNYVNYMYVEYNGTTGWIKDYMNVSTCRRLWNKEDVKLKKDYKTINIETMEETGEFLPAGEIFNIKYCFSTTENAPSIYAYYLENNNKSGWVSMTYDESEDAMETIANSVEFDDLTKVNISEILESKENVKETENSAEENNPNTKENIVNNQFRNCVLIAIIIAVIAMIVIIVINKKRKK